MVTDNGQDASQRFQWPANVLTSHRMLLHHGPFFGSKIRTLLENLIRNSNLAEIMQITAAAQRHNRFIIQAKVPAEGARILRQALAMSLSVRIAALHAQAERAQH